MIRTLLVAILLGVPASAQTTAVSPTVVTGVGDPSPSEKIATLAAIRASGHLTCGTIEPVDDWDGQGEHGDLSSLGSAFCEGVAAAIFGDKAKVEVLRFPAEAEALHALQIGKVQLVAGLSPSTEASIQYGVAFGRPLFFDTQRFLVPAAASFKDATNLRDNLVCAMNNTPSESRLRDYMAQRKIAYGLQAHSEQGEMDASVAVAHCAAGSALESRLAESRGDFPANAPEFVFLPERFGLEPVAPAYRYGDQKFALLVDMTLSALVEAEELGITQANVQQSTSRTDLAARRLLGSDRAVGQALHLPANWAVQVISAVGNYGEVFSRTLGKAYHLERGPNALSSKGGLMNALPLQ